MNKIKIVTLNTGKNAEKLDHSCISGRNANGAGILENNFTVS